MKSATLTNVLLVVIAVACVGNFFQGQAGRNPAGAYGEGAVRVVGEVEVKVKNWGFEAIPVSVRKWDVIGDIPVRVAAGIGGSSLGGMVGGSPLADALAKLAAAPPASVSPQKRQVRSGEGFQGDIVVSNVTLGRRKGKAGPYSWSVGSEVSVVKGTATNVGTSTAKLRTFMVEGYDGQGTLVTTRTGFLPGCEGLDRFFQPLELAAGASLTFESELGVEPMPYGVTTVIIKFPIQ